MKESMQIRIGKATEADFDAVRNLFLPMEALFDSRWAEHESGWLEWGDEDPDKQELLKVRKELAQEQGCEEDWVDNRLIVFEFIKRRYRRAKREVWLAKKK